MTKETWRVSTKKGGVVLVKVKKDLKERFHNMCSARHVSMEQIICKLLRQALAGKKIGEGLFKDDPNSPKSS
jgi:hypothetical protein